eukprot:TRINITY_DN5762_c0_g1_i1.p1 TRINITY_DN5762_c0_g1~~TRINITY_DN5762_c0_g1_i1.p1  ORF type:complete len:721 (+),score=188.49 TRINITY_DN5762_c0_g1_i1:126-2165(+)
MSKQQTNQKNIHYSAFHGDVDTVHELLKAGVKASLEDDRKSTALHHAAFNGHKNVIKLLLSYGAQVDAKDCDQATPLHNSAFNGHKKAMRYLLDKSADVNSKDVDGNTPLHKATFYGHIKCMELLLNSGADLDAQDAEGATPLHKAASSNHLKPLIILVEREANIKITDNAGATALHKVAFLGNGKGVALLLSKGAAVDAEDNEGYTALHNASYQGHPECIKQLLDGGGFINKTSKHGCTALHYAAANSQVACITFLANKGASLDVKESKRGRTPLHYAISKGSKESIQSLARAGADVHCKDNKGKSPMDIAKRNGTDCYLDPSNWSASDPKDNVTSIAGSTNNFDKATTDLRRSDSQSVDRYGFVGTTPAISTKNLEADKKREAERALKWNKVIRKWDRFAKTSKLKAKIYKGIPDCVRGEVWKRLCASNKLRNLHTGKYALLLSQTSPHTDQINKDINRTFPRHVDFQDRGGRGQTLLFNVLKAYSVYDPNVGYCQGMGFVAAMLLMYMEEEDAFWVLVRLCDAYGMSGLFMDGFPALQDCYALVNKMLDTFLPELAAHLRHKDVSADMFCPQWFLTSFVIILPFALVLRVWDIVFQEGLITFFLVSVSLLKIYEDQMLTMDSDALFSFLKFNNGDQQTEIDAERLISVMTNFRQKPFFKQQEKEHPNMLKDPMKDL